VIVGPALILADAGYVIGLGQAQLIHASFHQVSIHSIQTSWPTTTMRRVRRRAMRKKTFKSLLNPKSQQKQASFLETPERKQDQAWV
jgi:hypothetical protein